MDLFEKYKEFNENVGNFILTFSTVEFQIGTLAGFIQNGGNSQTIDADIIGLDLGEKLKIVREKIKPNQDLYTKWEKLEGHLSSCNDFRRFISHGIVSNHIPNPSITGVIRAKRDGVIGFRVKELTNDDVFLHLRKIIDVHTGKNGLGVLVPEIKSWLID
jgi:hypothetical protein